MDPNSLTDTKSLLNQQIASQEALINYLHKAKALTNVTLNIDFLGCDKTTLHDYLWTLNDLLEHASFLSEKIFNNSLREAKLNIKRELTFKATDELHRKN
jgi:hypothetical protein